jgi:ribosomal 50S subunit-associated protein YjgA (DUF615 family)
MHTAQQHNSTTQMTKEAANEEDTVVLSVIRSFQERSRAGQLKYGTTLDRTDLTPQQWAQHMQEELMDAILYLERLKREMGARNLQEK